MKKKLIIFIPICVLLVVCICIAFILFKKSKTDELVGLWSIDGNTKYEFDGKGNGKLIVPLSEYEFTYNINENILSIDFKNEASQDTDYIFKVDNDKLELTNKKENYLKFTLKKVDGDE